MRLPVVAAALSLLLAACSDSNQADPAIAQPQVKASLASDQARRPHVLETFKVGDDVYVRSLAINAQRNTLWVGTSLGAHEINLETREPVNTFTRENGLANEYVFTTFVDSAGGNWFGTNGGGASYYRDGKWKTWFPMHGLADYWVYAFAEEGPGAVWIGTWAGANRLDVKTGHFERYYDELVNEWVYGIGVDSKHRIWFGTEGGISMYDGARWTEWTHDDGLGAANISGLPPSANTGLGTRARHDLSVTSQGEPTYNPNYVFCILVAGDDTVWAGTWGGGASRFDGETWTNLSRRDGLAGDVVFTIAQDGRGNLWFGTDKGLSRYDGSNWQKFGVAEGLLGEAVYAVAADANGEIWVGTRGGVARVGYD